MSLPMPVVPRSAEFSGRARKLVFCILHAETAADPASYHRSFTRTRNVIVAQTRVHASGCMRLPAFVPKKTATNGWPNRANPHGRMVSEKTAGRLITLLCPCLGAML